MSNNRILLIFISFLFLISCDENSFVERGNVSQNPFNLKYMEIKNAREGKGVTTTAPTIDSNGVIPVYELVSIKTGDGTLLDESYSQYVSIGGTTIKEVNILDVGGNVVGTGKTYNTSQNGIITISDGNKFTVGDYYFTLRATIESNGKQFSTVFENALHLNVGPLLPSILIFSPKNQNLVFGANSKTTVPIVPNSNLERKFELGSDSDKLVIDQETGVISISPSYQFTTNETLKPIIKVVSKISGEVSTFTNVISIIISDVPVVVPIESILFFYPTLKTSGSFPTGGEGFSVQVDVPGNGEDIWGVVDNSAGTALGKPTERPVTNTAQTVLETQTFTGSTTTPTSSWMVTTTQDLTPFQFGFKLSFNYYYMPAYQTYMADGRTPTDIEVYISTDYTGGDIQDATGKWLNGTWTKVNNNIKCNRSLGVSSGISTGAPWGPEFLGTPYPGDQNGSDPDGRKMPGTTFYNKWVKCSYDIPVSQISKNYTVAFKVNSYFQGSLLNNTTVPGRGGSFFLSDFYFKASE